MIIVEFVFIFCMLMIVKLCVVVLCDILSPLVSLVLNVATLFSAGAAASICLSGITS